MAALFGITAATAEVKLGEQRQAETVFNVFNASGRYIRGRAKLKAADPAATEWLALGGDRDRDFPVGGSVQYLVRISVPPEAPPGRYEFRLDMVDVQNPEEEYTRGPAVSFQVPEPPPRPPPPSPWNKWLLIGAAVVLLVAVAAWFFWPRRVEVPNLANLTVEAAADTLQAHGLALGSVDTFPPASHTWHPSQPERPPVADEAVAAGLVISSAPPAKSSARRGQAVDLFVSSGQELIIAIEEDCLAFDADAVTLRLVGEERTGRPLWLLTVGNVALKEFDDENEARQAGKLMATYRMNSQCFVGPRDNPSMEYWLTDGRALAGSTVGEDCLAFNPNNLEVEQDRSGWFLMDGRRRVIQFSNEREGRLAAGIIYMHQFTHACYVGRPDPSFMYLRR